MKLAERMSRIGTESAFDVLARARALEAEGREIVHLQIGEPDFDTPAHVTEAGIQALRDGYTHYVPALGIPQLRDAIAEHISQTRGIPVERGNVCVSPGGKPIMFWAIMALCQEGDEVIVPDPSFTKLVFPVMTPDCVIAPPEFTVNVPPARSTVPMLAMPFPALNNTFPAPAEVTPKPPMVI